MSEDSPHAAPAPDLQPTLIGERILVRPIAPDDFDSLFTAASDPLVWEQHPASDRHEKKVFRSYFDDALTSKSALVFIDRANNDVIGSSRYHGFDPVAGEIEIGWTFLSRAYWGGTYNREVKQLMLEHAFGFASTVVFWVGETNNRSRRAMEKIGGVLREGTFTRIEAGDAVSVIYEIRRP